MSGGHNSSKTQNYYPGASRMLWLMSNPVADRIMKQMRRTDPKMTGGTLGQASQNELLSTIRGEKMTVDNNPYLAGTADEIARRSQESLSKALAGISGQAQQAGRLYAVKSNQNMAQAARQANDDLTGRLTDLYRTNYDQERNRQYNAIPLGVNTGDRLYNMLLQMGNVMSGAGTSSSSGWNAGI